MKPAFVIPLISTFLCTQAPLTFLQKTMPPFSPGSLDLSGLPFTSGIFKLNFFHFFSFATEYMCGYTQWKHIVLPMSYLIKLIFFYPNTIDELLKNTAVYTKLMCKTRKKNTMECFWFVVYLTNWIQFFRFGGSKSLGIFLLVLYLSSRVKVLKNPPS